MVVGATVSDNSISLYFGLKEGERADLEVVAAAAIQWVELVRAAATAIEPNAQVRVELIDANEGSLRLNTIFEWVEEHLARIERGSGEYPRLRKLAIALAVFLVVEGPQKFEYYFGESPKLELSEEDRRKIDELLKCTRDVPEIDAPRRKFFKTLERDPSITEIGVAETRDSEPVVTVPSKEFAERGGLWAIVEEEQERTVRSILDVVLISPVLISEPRTWKFQPVDGLPEFSAVMRDPRFLKALEESHVQERLRTGIQMTIRLEVREYKVGRSWKVKRKGRSVTEVISPKVFD
jgi:hypothetical protein